MPRIARLLLAACLALLLAACPKAPDKGTLLEQIQYDYSAAIRWGDFEGAWTLVDPEVRKAHPLTDLELSRYKQVQISQYSALGVRAVPGGEVQREIAIGVINRNTMAERNVRYTERWRYDEAAKTWWQVGGLPNLWGD